MHYASVFQLNCHRLVVQLHQESVECDFIRVTEKEGWGRRAELASFCLRCVERPICCWLCMRGRATMKRLVYSRQ